MAKENLLIVNIRNYKKEDKSDELRQLRIKYVSMARIFVEEFGDNVSKSSIELAKDYPAGGDMDDWKDFLDFPPVHQYRQKFLDDMKLARVNSGIISGDGTRESLAIQKEMDARSGKGKNSGIVVFLLGDIGRE